MHLLDLVKQHRLEILTCWFDKIVASYPEQTANLLRKRKDRFQNPVGAAYKKATVSILRVVLCEMELGEVREDLDYMIKIRSVQEFGPDRALAVIFLLKRAIREILADELKAKGLYDQLWELEDRIDEILLAGFDSYMRSRETLYELRANNARREVAKLVERLNGKQNASKVTLN